VAARLGNAAWVRVDARRIKARLAHDRHEAAHAAAQVNHALPAGKHGQIPTVQHGLAVYRNADMLEKGVI